MDKIQETALKIRKYQDISQEMGQKLAVLKAKRDELDKQRASLEKRLISLGVSSQEDFEKKVSSLTSELDTCLSKIFEVMREVENGKLQA